MGATISDLDTNQFDSSLLELFDGDLPDGILPVRPRGFGITRNELIEQKGLTFAQAKRFLEGKVKTGELEKILMSNRQHEKSNPMVYYRPGTWPPKETTRR